MAHSSRLTKEVVNNRIAHKGISLIGEYTGSHSKALFRCSIQHEWLAEPNRVMFETGCPYCAKNNPIEAYKKFISIIKNRGFLIIGEYKGTRLRVDVICNKGHSLSIKPADLLSGHGCFKCSGQHPEIAEINFLEKAAQKGFKVIGKYKNAKTPVEAQCKNGHLLLLSPNKINRPTKVCPLCPKPSSIIANQKFEDAARKRGFLISGTYTTSNTPTEIMCPQGHKTLIQPRFFRDGANCKVCSNNNFDRTSQGFFYVYHLKRNGIEGIGFGITNALKQRQKDHKIEFKKTNTTFEPILIQPFENGVDALVIERELKKHPSIINFGVEGFKTECFPVEYKDYVLGKIMA